MWSVTVANYPHWVEFDCGSVKTLKGFVYLPRQDSRNGNIKEYSIQLSNDGKNWGETIHQGTFENNQKEKKKNQNQKKKEMKKKVNIQTTKRKRKFSLPIP